MDRRNFKGKVAVVTGGASGIGLAVCRELAEHGAAVAMLDMDNETLALAQNEFEDKEFEILAVKCDVTRQAECFKAIDRVLSHFGRIDILFNNAGITQRGLFSQTKIEVIQKVMDVNFFGSLYCTKAALDSLIENKGVIIVNESIAGVAPLVGRTGYSASKHALHGLFTSLRCELRSKGVHVMIVAPGFIKTNLQTRALGTDGKIATHEQTRIGKQDTPQNAAKMIVKGLQKEKSNLILTFMGRLGYYIHRLSPILYEKMMTNRFKKELS
ncbi:MAG: SDR family oxidoreductase [Desulfobacteraceae bacterium]|nr:SDR family oxidoreductase [Desulfobacteraceae bacterium]